MSRRDEEPWPPEELEHDEDEMFARREARSRLRHMPDFVRRAIEDTMGSMTQTQNASKEALQFFLSTTDKTKREIVRIVASEVGTFLRHVDISSEVIKVLTGVQADVNISVRFRRTEEGGLEPELKATRPPSHPEDADLPEPGAAARPRGPTEPGRRGHPEEREAARPPPGPAGRRANPSSGGRGGEEP